MSHPLKVFTFAILVTLASPLAASAQQEWLCDPQTTDCRQPILDLISHETVRIDVAFWFMEDDRYRAAIVSRFQAGVPVRILVDQRANASKRLNEQELGYLRDAGIPMRDKYVGDILHWKMMLFHGQDVVEFSKANYAPDEFVPVTPNVNYDDEAIFFTNDDRLTNSFRRRFEDNWMDTTVFENFGNVTGPLVRVYPVYPIDPAMDFPPLEDYSNRAVSRYNHETQSIDATVFRVTDHRQADAMIAAVARGVPVRLLTEPTEYRNPVRLYDSKHVDRMYVGGVQIKMRQHDGLTHEGAVVMYGLGEVIVGSSNWTTASASYQDEHNYFYNPSLGKPWFFQWFANQFATKWNDTTNYVPFQPLPPDAPINYSPLNLAAGQSSSVTLTWDGGTWAYFYDIYFGTSPNPPLLMSNQLLGSPEPGQNETFAVTNLLPGTTYYWRIVGKTYAQMATSGPTWSFTTAGIAAGETPYGGTPAAIPGTIQAENFDEGGQNVAWYDTTAGNSGGVYRTNTDVDIEATLDTGGGYDVMKTRAGEWMRYTVNVASTGSYQLDTRFANFGTGARIHVEVDGVDKTGPIAVPDTGGWQLWQTVTTTGIPLSAGQHVLRVVFDAVGSGGGAGNLNWLRFSATAKSTSATALTSSANPSSVGQSVTFTATVTGSGGTPTGTVTFSDGATTLGTTTLNASGVATFTTSTLAAGSHSMTASYSGDGTFGTSTSSALTQTSTAPSPTTPFGGTPVSLPGTVQVANYDLGGQNVAYYDTTAGNTGGQWRTDDVDIGPNTDSDPLNGGFYVGWTRVTEWLKYTVNVTATRNYTVNVRVANVGSGATFRIEVDGADATGSVAVPNTGDWAAWQTVSLSGIPLSQGQHVLRLVMVTRNVENSGVGNYGYISFQ